MEDFFFFSFLYLLALVGVMMVMLSGRVIMVILSGRVIVSRMPCMSFLGIKMRLTYDVQREESSREG